MQIPRQSVRLNGKLEIFVDGCDWISCMMAGVCETVCVWKGRLSVNKRRMVVIGRPNRE